MNSQTQNYDFILEPEDNLRLVNLCGHLDEHIKQLESSFKVEIKNRGNAFSIVGNLNVSEVVAKVLQRLYADAEKTNITPVHVRLLVHEEKTDSRLDAGDSKSANNQDEESDLLLGQGARSGRNLDGATGIRPRTSIQRSYIHNILNHGVNFGVGPAGTGKTYLAVACAVDALEREQVRRIQLVRPAVEAGERLGFLPGDLSQKIDPYLRPLYDALYEMLGFERVNKLIETGVIEVTPLAYMRGRTLNDSFVILDEAQNATIEQMKMFLTRIGFGSVAVITGDITQVDLPKEKKSGLKHVVEVLKNVEGISFTFFNTKDVMRHPLVQSIVEAYDNSEQADQGGKR